MKLNLSKAFLEAAEMEPGGLMACSPEIYAAMTEPVYPELPTGCTIEHGRRQLAVGEKIQNGDRIFMGDHRGWTEVCNTIGGTVQMSAVSRPVEELK